MEHKNTIGLRIIGFITSLVLTLSAYFIIVYPKYFAFGIKNGLTAILVLAVLQALVQFIFFINLWREKGPRWNTIFFISTVLIVLIIIGFTIWVMNHLNYNMMPQ